MRAESLMSAGELPGRPRHDLKILGIPVTALSGIEKLGVLLGYGILLYIAEHDLPYPLLISMLDHLLQLAHTGGVMLHGLRGTVEDPILDHFPV
jgi:hypothetical protein